MKHFHEHTSNDDDANIDEFLDLVNLGYRDMGRVLETYRSGPVPGFWIPYVALWLIVPLTLFFAPNDPVVVAVTFAVLLTVFGGGIIAGYLSDRHRVCEHGLVVGFKKKSKYVIPYATIDPGRIRIAKALSLLGRRPEYRGRMLATLRIGFVASRGVALNGLDHTIGTAGNPDSDTPFTWWFLGTRRPEELVAAIERAMVADGYAAEGLADRAQAQRFTATWTPSTTNPVPPRGGQDPIIGTSGPLME